MTETVPAPKPAGMPDVQGASDLRNVAIDQVGVKSVRYPITLRQACGGEQNTVATINLYVSLPKHKKGTHMSRFLEILNHHHRAITPELIIPILHEMKTKLDAKDAHIELTFPYFIEKSAPVTGAKGLMNYVCTFEGTSNGTDDFIMGVRAPATSLCPCSKEISQYGAHNQRCEITAKVRTKSMLWIEDLVEDHGTAAASAPVYAVLKRPDEKFVTEQAFDHPKFVEDIIRDLRRRPEQRRPRAVVLDRKRKLRIHPQPQRLRHDRTRQIPPNPISFGGGLRHRS